MNRERWRQIDEVFNAALRLDPAERGAWVRRACGDDDVLRAEVERLLARDERASRDGFLTPPEPAGPPADLTVASPSRDDLSPRGGPTSIDRGGSVSVDETGCFAPRAAIAAGTAAYATAESPPALQARLRELAIIYVVLFGMATVWRLIFIGADDSTLRYADMIVIVALLGLIALLTSGWLVSLTWLRALELGMIGMLACRVAFIQYRLILGFSLRDDPMMAQLAMKNVVLVTSILILTYGLYVPKSWRRAALVVGPLALLPFAVLLALYLRNPEAMGWLGRGWRKSETARFALFSFDAMLLLIVAVAASYGAHTISRLRRQVAEARQLGQYRLCRRIGTGGMGDVYLAEHQLLKRPCALKLIRPGAVDDPRAVERFEREVRITATLSHPNTVEIYDYGRAEDGTYYYVMEYLRGLSLGELVERHGPLPAARAVYLLRQVCLALREAHSAGLIHRDIKPSNIFAARRGGMDDVAKLLDFGLVRPAATTDAPRLSGEGQILGTPLYMSPEQASGRTREVDARSDLYSLGAVAFYVLTGKPPFDHESAIELVIAHARDQVRPPSLIRAGIPEDLEHIVLQCLAKDAADRFSDAESLERALGECACASEWDQKQATRWWRDFGRTPATPAAVA